MKFWACAVLSLVCLNDPTFAFTQAWRGHSIVELKHTELHVSIGLGPEKGKDDEVKELVPGLDFEVPDHESYRTSRRSKLDEQCDNWFESLMGNEIGIMGSLAEDAKTILMTPVPLVNEASSWNCKSFSCSPLHL